MKTAFSNEARLILMAGTLTHQWPPQHSATSPIGAIAFSFVIFTRNSAGP
jgi:hypothetical protein